MAQWWRYSINNGRRMGFVRGGAVHVAGGRAFAAGGSMSTGDTMIVSLTKLTKAEGIKHERDDHRAAVERHGECWHLRKGNPCPFGCEGDCTNDHQEGAR